MNVAAGQMARPPMAVISRRWRRKINTCPCWAQMAARADRRKARCNPSAGRRFLGVDLCTKEEAIATPDELRAQAQGVCPAGSMIERNEIRRIHVNSASAGVLGSRLYQL